MASRPFNTIAAPAAASPRASANPMPPLEPVISASLPLRENCCKPDGNVVVIASPVKFFLHCPEIVSGRLLQIQTDSRSRRVSLKCRDCQIFLLQLARQRHENRPQPFIDRHIGSDWQMLVGGADHI